ncbi:MAG: glycosyltransferase family 4 protein [Kiritimatiellae bacterium]|nr:glycosyltransferase family 4 protein [Kiritimatiellia bacterium]
MKICLDYQPAVTQRAGIGRYTRVLAEQLPALMNPKDSLKLFYFDFKGKGEQPSNLPSNVSIKRFRLCPGAIMQKLWNYSSFPSFDMLAGNADIYHFTNFLSRPVNKGKVVASIHDMSFMRYPEFTEEKNLAYLTRGIKRTIDSADAIITISKFSAEEIEYFFPSAKGKVFYSHLGIAQNFSPSSVEEIDAVKQKYKLERPYVITVGTIEPRKNHLLLVDAFEQIAAQGIDLVVVGGIGWKSDKIMERLTTSKFAPQIHILNHLGDGELPALYSGASVFALPSYYEGFGFPPLEAMGCGTPVVSAPGGSLKEVIENAGIIVEDYNADAWATELMRAITDTELRKSFINKGLLHIKKFTWDKTVADTLKVYENLVR